jgi:hypothetical protein
MMAGSEQRIGANFHLIEGVLHQICLDVENNRPIRRKELIMELENVRDGLSLLEVLVDRLSDVERRVELQRELADLRRVRVLLYNIISVEDFPDEISRAFSSVIVPSDVMAVSGLVKADH